MWFGSMLIPISCVHIFRIAVSDMWWSIFRAALQLGYKLSERSGFYFVALAVDTLSRTELNLTISLLEPRLPLLTAVARDNTKWFYAKYLYGSTLGYPTIVRRSPFTLDRMDVVPVSTSGWITVVCKQRPALHNCDVTYEQVILKCEFNSLLVLSLIKNSHFP